MDKNIALIEENYIFVEADHKLSEQMKRFFYLLPALLLLSTGCTTDKITEGEIEYEITYPNADISPFMSAILPETMTVIFQGTKTKTRIARGKIFSTEIISDEADQSLEMRLTFGDKLLYTILTKEDIDQLLLSQPYYTVKPLNKQDSVAGMYANSYEIDCKNDTIQHATAWFTEDLIHTNAYWYTSYAKVQGFPLIYDAERYGVLMHVSATKLIKREIKPEEFDRDPTLIEVSFETYEAEVQSLFDALMN